MFPVGCNYSFDSQSLSAGTALSQCTKTSYAGMFFAPHALDTVSSVKKLVSFYVDEHNARIPHSAFRGQTPDEMYFGTGDHIPDDLHIAKKKARESRMEVNRSTSCPTCDSLAWINN